jgi:hypothetical protein
MVVRHPPPIFLAPYAAINALSHLGIVKYFAFYSLFQFQGQTVDFLHPANESTVIWRLFC